MNPFHHILDSSKEDKIEFLEDFAHGWAPGNVQHAAEHIQEIALELLMDAEPDVRVAALNALEEDPPFEDADVLLEMVQNDPSRLVQQRAVLFLGVYMEEYLELGAHLGQEFGEIDAGPMPLAEYERVREFLFRLFASENISIGMRSRALEALAPLPHQEVEALIEQAWNHPDIQMRRSAIIAMGHFDERIYGEQIVQAMRDENRELRLEAVAAAGTAQVRAAAVLLRRILRDSDRDLACEAIVALGKLGLRQDKPLLTELSRSRDAQIRQAAQEGLEAYEDALLAEEVQQSFDDSSDWDGDDTDDEPQGGSPNYR